MISSACSTAPRSTRLLSFLVLLGVVLPCMLTIPSEAAETGPGGTLVFPEHGIQLVPANVAKATLTGLALSGKSQVRKEKKDGKDALVLQVRGQYPAQRGWALLIDHKQVTLGADALFEVALPVRPDAVFEFSAVGPEGAIQTAQYRIHVLPRKPAAAKPAAPAAPKPVPVPAPKRHDFAASLGITHLSYQEAASGGISQLAFVGKGSHQFWIQPRKWAVSAGGFFTLLPVSTLPSTQVPRFIGLNLRATYVVPRLQAPWQLSLAGGFYYTTMLTSGFGFSNLMGPQLFCVLRRELSRRDAVSGYLKLAPVASDLGVQSFSSREIAVGVSYFYPLKNNRTLSFGVDAADLRFIADEWGVRSDSLSLSVGYNW